MVFIVNTTTGAGLPTKPPASRDDFMREQVPDPDHEQGTAGPGWDCRSGQFNQAQIAPFLRPTPLSCRAVAASVVRGSLAAVWVCLCSNRRRWWQKEHRQREARGRNCAGGVFNTCRVPAGGVHKGQAAAILALDHVEPTTSWTLTWNFRGAMTSALLRCRRWEPVKKTKR